MTNGRPSYVAGQIDACDRALARLRDPTLSISPRLIGDIEAIRADAQRELNLSGPAPRVLLAENDAATRMVCRLNLEGAGFEVSEVTDGAAALAVARRHPHDLILVDGSLRQLDGWDLTTALQADAGTRASVIVFLSGQIDKARQADAIDRGATAYLTKPFQPTTLSDLALRLLAPGAAAAVRAAERHRLAMPA